MATWYFYYPKRISFYPLDYWQSGLGGGEGSIVLLTEGLARAGEHVEVFNCCYRPGIYNGVTWRMDWEIDHAAPPDVLVSVRFQESIRPELVARKRIYWMLDNRSEGTAQFIKRFGSSGGKVSVASKTICELLLKRQIDGPIQDIPLPVERTLYDANLERHLACLYCSVPNRGLDILLLIWPRIRDVVPDAELWVTGGYQLWGYSHEEAQERVSSIVGSHPLPDGVRMFGVLPKRQIAELQASCALMLYPCRFDEMFCLAAAECSAAGTPIITSARGALQERVVDGVNGILIPGELESAQTQQRFVEATVKLLRDPTERQRMSLAAKQLTSDLTTDAVVAKWKALVS